MTGAAIPTGFRGGGDADLPLSGLRVVELCWVWAGPLVGQILADLGAEVIKVEWRSRFDLYRTRGVERLRGVLPEEVRRESSFSFHSLNRNKIGMTLDLKHDRGVEVLGRLLGRSQLLVENFTAGTLERLGLGPDVLHAFNPELSVVSLSGPGRGSPVESMRSYGLVLSAIGGAESLITQDGDFLGSPTFVLSDPNAAVFGVLAALGAVLDSRHCGRGLAVDISQIEAAATLVATAPPPEMVPSGAVPATSAIVLSTDGAELAVSVPRSAAAGEDALRALLAGHDTRAIIERCAARGGTAVPVLTLEEAARADVSCPPLLPSVHPVTGPEQLVAAPWRVDGHRPALRKPAPTLGESSDYVLRHVLGMTSQEIDELRKDGVV